MNDWQRLDELLERGLDYYGRQLVAEAIQCWREVLYLSPGHQLALEYLEAAGATAEQDQAELAQPRKARAQTKDDPKTPVTARATTDEQPMSLESLSTLTVELIRERKFEEALALLYTAHGESPKDPSISRSINVVKQRLLREYRTEIGDLSQVPKLALDDVVIDELPLSEDERELVPLVDGIVALEDVLQSTGLGALQSLRALAHLLRRRVIVLAPAQAAPDKRKEPPLGELLAPPAPPPMTEPRPVPTLKLVPPLEPEPPAPPPAAPAKAAPDATAPALSSPAAAAPAAAAPAAAAPAAAAQAAVPTPIAPTSSAPNGSGSIKLPVADARSKSLPISIINAPRPEPKEAKEPKASEPTPNRPSRYAAHVAEAVRAHLQGHRARALELLQLCIQECPDDPTSRRTLDRLKERLGAVQGGPNDRKDQR